MIPSHILSRKILTQCPELNISETQLSAELEAIMDQYHPYQQQYGVITHINQYDAHIAKDYPCKFCGAIGVIYHGYLQVKFPYTYMAFFECKICGHTERL